MKIKKFDDIVYVRPDAEEILKSYQNFIEKTKRAEKAEDLTAILSQQAALYAAFNEMAQLCRIRNSINMADKFYLEEEAFFAQCKPKVESKRVELFDIIAQSPFAAELEKTYPKDFFANRRLQSKATRENILHLLAEENKLNMKYRQLMTREKNYFSQNKLEKTHADRSVREQSWKKEGEYYLSNKDDYLNLYDNLIFVRTQIAKELGFSSFTEVGYLRNLRNCYGREEVKTFRESVKKHIVPFVAKLKQKQAEILCLDRFRYYDFYVYAKQGTKLCATPQGVIDATVKMFQSFGEESKTFIEALADNGYIHAFSRPNKMGGAFCRYLEREKMPFVFMTMNSEAGDVSTLTHELGHAFAEWMTKDNPLAPYTDCSSDIGETPAMVMEFLAWKYYDAFYAAHSKQAQFSHLAGAFSNLPYMCMVDEFQHIVYDNPALTIKERNDKWRELESQYRPFMDYQDNDFYNEGLAWIRQEHIFTHPFYYIDYALAQIVTLQFFSIMEQDWDKAWKMYNDFIQYIGFYNFRDILKKSHLKNPLTEDFLQEITAQAEKALERLS